MCGDGVCASRSLQHEKLGQDSDSLEINAESPQYLDQSILVRKQDGQYCGSPQEVLDTESIAFGVDGGLEVLEHQVDGVSLGADEKDLEGGVVEHVRSVEGPKEVEVSGDVDDEVEELRLE